MSTPTPRQTVAWSLAQLRPNDNNPRRILDEDLERLKESLRRYPDLLWARPLLLSNRTGELVVIGGNQRLRALLELRYEEAPVHLLDGLTEEQEAEILIRDNVSNGLWDGESLYANFGHFPLIDWGLRDWEFEPAEPIPPKFEPSNDRVEGLVRIVVKVEKQYEERVREYLSDMPDDIPFEVL